MSQYGEIIKGGFVITKQKMISDWTLSITTRKLRSFKSLRYISNKISYFIFFLHSWFYLNTFTFHKIYFSIFWKPTSLFTVFNKRGFCVITMTIRRGHVRFLLVSEEISFEAISVTVAILKNTCYYNENIKILHNCDCFPQTYRRQFVWVVRTIHTVDSFAKINEKLT